MYGEDGAARARFGARHSGLPGAVAAGLAAVMFVAIFLSSISPQVLAGTDGAGGLDSKAQLGNRSVQVTNESGFYTVRSSVVVAGVEDSFKIELKIGTELELALKYKESAPELEHRIDISLRFRNVVEFEDRNGNGNYEPGEEVQLYELGERTLGPIEYKTEDRGAAGPVHVLSVSARDRVFSVRFYMTGELTSVGGTGSAVNVTPSEIKFDIHIRDFRFRENSTRLAVDGQLVTRESMQFDDQTPDERMNVAEDESSYLFRDRDNMTGAFLSWTNKAFIDGQNRPIQLDIPQSGVPNETRRLTINYPRGSDIFHDPKVGVVINSIGSHVVPVGGGGLAWTYGAVAVTGIALAAVSAGILADRRRFRKRAQKRDPFELRDYPHFRGRR